MHLSVVNNLQLSVLLLDNAAPAPATFKVFLLQVLLLLLLLLPLIWNKDEQL